MSQHLLHVYTGDGKGKTTAGMGLALRMLGHGRPVIISQFMKDGKSGEITALGRFENATLFEGARMKGFFGRMTPDQQEETRQEHQESLARLTALIQDIKPALTVMDELNVAIAMGLVRIEDAFAVIDAALETGDAVVTGRYAPEKMLERADYVSRIAAEKHPFNEGVQARKGIEF